MLTEIITIADIWPAVEPLAKFAGFVLGGGLIIVLVLLIIVKLIKR